MAEFSSARRFAAICVKQLQEWSLRQSVGHSMKWFVPLNVASSTLRWGSKLDSNFTDVVLLEVRILLPRHWATTQLFHYRIDDPEDAAHRWRRNVE